MPHSIAVNYGLNNVAVRNAFVQIISHINYIFFGKDL